MCLFDVLFVGCEVGFVVVVDGGCFGCVVGFEEGYVY